MLRDRRRVRVLAVIFGIVSLALPRLEASDSGKSGANSVGRKLESFQLTDFRGRDLTEKDFDESKLLVVAFLGVECPLAKLYSERLQKIRFENLARRDVCQQFAFHVATQW